MLVSDILVQRLCDIYSSSVYVQDYPALYPGFESEPESMEWVSQYADANMVKTDFFEARSTAYAKSTALIDDL